MNYKVFCISVDQYKIARATCVYNPVHGASKLEAMNIANQRTARSKAAGRMSKCIVIPDTAEAHTKLAAQVEQVNAKRKPMVDAYLEAQAKAKRAEIDARAEKYRREKEAELRFLRVVGFEYDNQQRVNEYNGNKRG